MNDLLLSAAASTSDYLRKTAAVYLVWAGTAVGLFVLGTAAYAHTPGSLMFLFVSAVSAFLLAGPLIRRARSFASKKESSESKERDFVEWSSLLDLLGRPPAQSDEGRLRKLLTEQFAQLGSNEQARMQRELLNELVAQLSNELERAQRQGHGLPKT